MRYLHKTSFGAADHDAGSLCHEILKRFVLKLMASSTTTIVLYETSPSLPLFYSVVSTHPSLLPAVATSHPWNPNFEDPQQTQHLVPRL